MASTYNPVLGQVGEKILRRRQELGMTATELAIQADMPASSLSLIESGQRSVRIDNLHKIATALRVPLSDLQADALDEFSEIPPDILPLTEKLKQISMDQRRMMIKMFIAQIDTLVS